MTVDDTFLLNNEEYEVLRNFGLTLPGEGDDGDDAWEWLHVLNRDTNAEYFLLFENNDHFGYLLSESSFDLHEEDVGIYDGNVVVMDEDLFGFEEGSLVEIGHGVLHNRELSEGLEGPLEGTPWVSSFHHLHFFQRPVYREREGLFYTDAFPAAEVETEEVQRTHVSGASGPLNLVLLLGLIALGVGEFLQIRGTIELDFNLPFYDAFWMGGLASCALVWLGRKLPVYAFVETLAAAFCLLICFKGIDNYLGQAFSGDNASIGQGMVLFRLGTLGLLVLLQRLSRRWYGIVSRAAFWTALASLSIFGAGILLYSLIDEYWWGAHFSFYLGALPWAVFWVGLFVWNLVLKYKDFKAVPLTEEAFEKHLLTMIEEFGQGAEHVHERALELSVMADDTRDATELSDLPAVIAFEKLNDGFDQLRVILEAFDKTSLDEFEGLDFVDEDMDVLREDLEGLLEAFRSQQTQTPLQGLRLSPTLRAHAAAAAHAEE